MGLEKLIGLTASQCDCLNLPEGEDLAAGSTGMTLTDETGGFPMINALSASIDCNRPGNVIDLLRSARESAVVQVPIDVSRAMQSRFQQGANFRGTIGRPLLNPVYVLPQGATAAGVEVVVPVVRGQSMVVKAIHTAFPAAFGLTLNVWSSDPGFSFAPVILPVSGGKMDRHEIDLVLPFHSPAMASERRIIYRFYYTPTVNPFGNDMVCCGVSADYEGHFVARGFIDRNGSADSVYTPIGTSNKAMGLMLEVYTTCDVTGWLCETDEMDGYNLKDMLGQALRYQGAISLANTVLNTTNVNAYTLLSRETIYKVRSAYQKRYGEIIDWIGANVPHNAADCLGCERRAFTSTLQSLR